MIPRLYIDAPLAVNGAAPLSAEQAHYLKSVLRREAGAEICVFNGRDGEFAGEIVELKKRGGLAALGAQTRAPQKEPDIVLAFAPVKRGPLEMIVQKATELGVARFQPVITDRTVAPRLNLDRLCAIATEAAEQTGRLSVPRLDAPIKLAALLADWPSSRRLLFCDEAGDEPGAEWGGPQGRAAPLLETLNAIDSDTEEWALLTGPEGGFSPDERAVLRAHRCVTPATLGPRILRADTAAIAALTLLQAARGDWRNP